MPKLKATGVKISSLMRAIAHQLDEGYLYCDIIVYNTEEHPNRVGIAPHIPDNQENDDDDNEEQNQIHIA